MAIFSLYAINYSRIAEALYYHKCGQANLFLDDLKSPMPQHFKNWIYIIGLREQLKKTSDPSISLNLDSASTHNIRFKLSSPQLRCNFFTKPKLFGSHHSAFPLLLYAYPRPLKKSIFHVNFPCSHVNFIFENTWKLCHCSLYDCHYINWYLIMYIYLILLLGVWKETKLVLSRSTDKRLTLNHSSNVFSSLFTIPINSKLDSWAKNKLVSSAKCIIFTHLPAFDRSSLHNRNNDGPKLKPCRAPHLMAT